MTLNLTVTHVPQHTPAGPILKPGIHAIYEPWGQIPVTPQPGESIMKRDATTGGTTTKHIGRTDQKEQIFQALEYHSDGQ